MKLTARHFRLIHAFLTIFWLSLSVPTLLWWKNSIAFVAWISLYANVASHWAAYQGARSEETNEPSPCTNCGHKD